MTDPTGGIKPKIGLINRLLYMLMASSEYPHTRFEDMSISQVREVVFRVSLLIVMVAPLPVTVGALIQKDWGLLAVNLVFLAYVGAHNWLKLTRNKSLISPLVFLVISIGMLVGTVAAGHDGLIYWAYTFAGSIYLFLGSRTARVISIILLFPAGYFAYRILPEGHGIFFSAAMVVTIIIMEFLYSILYRQEKRLREQAVKDPLTGAYNRRALMDILEYTKALRERQGTPTSILMIDIDWFKAINDNFGHIEGDQVLSNLVAALTNRLRASDKVCRYGGEEFVAVLIGAKEHSAAEVANAIRKQISMTPLTERTMATISCGVAEIKSGETVLEWLERADTALYWSKSQGRDRVCVASEASTDKVRSTVP